MFKRKRLIASGIIAASLVFLTIFVRAQYSIPIVMYHSVKPLAAKGDLLTVSVDTFQRQMKFLKDNRYNVMALETVSEYISTRKNVPPRTIVLTFDDGYKDNYTYVFPVLKKYNFPATIFLILSRIGGPDMLSWDEVKEMRDSGLVSFGSHTFTHPFLDTLRSSQDLKREVSGSKSALEEKLGKPVGLFCYPCGRFNPEVIKAVKDAGYREAVGVNPGMRFSDNDIFVLKRMRISENSRNMLVFWFETTGYYNFVRQVQHRK
jgi:peptidoglycan/xylan/chitin deacetylase (PgdA/CDA1 family)